MKNCIIIPTYNERDNVVKLTHSLFKTNPEATVLIVDDNSPDGTAALATELTSVYPNLIVKKRTGGRGFGKSYIDGFKKIMTDDLHRITVMMDADFSHDPKAVPLMIEKLNNFDVVIGSRYIAGGKIENWHWKRKLLSRFANFYVRLILGVTLNDMTTGFMCFRKNVLDRIDLDSIKSDGYAFLVELKYRLVKAGFRITEYPIVFTERREGQSKMSTKVIWESVWLPWKLRFFK